mgnify:CR=1 FL=1
MEAKRKVRVGDLLVEKSLITEPQLMEALAEQKRTGKKIGRVLTDLSFVSEEKLLSCLADYFQYPYVDLNRYRIEADIVRLLPEASARRYRCIVLAEQPDGLLIGMSDPTDLMVIDDLQRQLKRPVLPAFISEDSLLTTLDSIYRRQDEIASIAGELEGELSESDFDITDLASGSDSTEAPVVRLLQSIFEDAVQVKASDIHIEPEEVQLRIRMRIDGDLQEQVMKERRIASALVSRLKIMSGLDISEKRIPQDGRFNIRVKNKSIDVRLSTMPVQFGESVVMRLLDQSGGILDLDSLGMPKDIQQRFNYLVERPHGMVLVTGPTGSGKTTTLYAGLNLLNDQSRNILTVEDPIEYAVDGIGQTQVNNKVGMTFAAGLRAILRQDPDVVMVGEIRDKETAEIAIQASLTGHLVLSTIHTNDTLGAITRLIDMGVEPYLLASSLRTIISQRLVRKLSSDGETYSGRQGIFEILDIDQNVKELINDDFSEKKVRDIIDPQHDFLEESGQKLIQEGVTTLEEVRRVLMEA